MSKMSIDYDGEPYHYDVVDDLHHFPLEKLEEMYYRMSMDYRIGDVPEERRLEHYDRWFAVEEALVEAGGDPNEIASQVEEDIDDWRDEWD